MTRATRRQRPDGGINIEYGTWGYDGPRFFMPGKDESEHYYFAYENEADAKRISKSHDKQYVDLWSEDQKETAITQDWCTATNSLMTHHLRPERASTGKQQMVCAYCGKTEKELVEIVQT